MAPGGGGGSNTPPDARDDVASGPEDADIRIPVLANDVDADGDALAVVSISDPSHGLATLDGTAIVYAPDVDFAGADSFRYTVRDARGGEDSALVSVTVTPLQDDPEADDDEATTPEDVPVVIDLLVNDADVDGDVIALVGAGGAAHGAVTVRPDGRSVSYTPAADVNGIDEFEYTVGDGHGGTDVGLVRVTVTPVNDAPRPRDDEASTAGGAIDVPVLANDDAGPADEAGQPLTVASVAAASHGTATVLASGAVRYVPAVGYTGPDSFAYVVSDGELTATATVRVDVTGQQAIPELCSVEATIAGTPGDDVLRGTPGDDVIRAGRGDDVIEGLGGNDLICGGAGSDRIVSGGGNDVIAGGTGADQIDSGAGNDRVRGGGGADSITTRAGADRVTSGNGADVVDTGDGPDVIAAGNGDDRLAGGAGDDRLDGGAGTDACDGGEGRNSLIRCE
ncbi:MAG: Ig-like domain-containing protein [Thermoleophilia bacterium]